MMRRFTLPALAAALALAATAPLVADVASARPARPDWDRGDRGELSRLRAENQQLRAANAELDRGLDQVEELALRLRDRRAGRRIAWIVDQARDRAGAYADPGQDDRYDDYPSRPGPGGGPVIQVMPMTHEQFAALSQQVGAARFSDDQLAIIRTAAQTSYFDVAQVIALMKLSGFDETRIEIAVILSSRVLDRDQWFRVEGALSFSSSRDTLRQRVRM